MSEPRTSLKRRRSASRSAFGVFALAGLVFAAALPSQAQVEAFPANFTVRDISTNGTTLHVRVGGQGPAVVLLHGFGDTGDMWAPVATELARDHTVIVPDLRGIGLSAQPAGGYDKKTQGRDIVGLLDALNVRQTDLVTHDIGNMVGYAFAAQFPERVTRFVIMDAPVPGIGPWDEALRSPKVWHFYFYGPDEERLVAGRERIFLDRFWNEFSANPGRLDEAKREHYAAFYSRPGAMHAAFNQFEAFTQDAMDNQAMLRSGGKLQMPVLAIGGGNSYGLFMATVMYACAVNVRGYVIPDAGHWLMEEQPAKTTAAIVAFLHDRAP